MNLSRYNKLLRNHIENCFIYYFILFLFLVIGIILGAIILKVLEESTQINIMNFSNPYFYGLLKNNLNKLYVFRISIIFNTVFILLTYLFGLFNLRLIIPAFYLIKGGLLGFNVGYLILNYSWKGFFVSIFGIYPQYLIYIPLLIIIGAISMTITLKVKFNSGKKIKIRNSNITEYTIIIIFITFLLFIGSVYEGFISPVFLDILKI